MKSVDIASGASQSRPAVSLTRRKRDNSAVKTQSSLRLLVALLYEIPVYRLDRHGSIQTSPIRKV
jgi:hypothetical protein